MPASSNDAAGLPLIGILTGHDVVVVSRNMDCTAAWSQASECKELLDPMRASSQTPAQHGLAPRSLLSVSHGFVSISDGSDRPFIANLVMEAATQPAAGSRRGSASSGEILFDILSESL